MNRTVKYLGITFLLALGLGVPGVQAQQPTSAEPQAPSRTVQTPAELVPALPVPRLVKFAGTLKDELGKSRTGVVGVTFALYKEQEGGAALWLETQNVELDEQGRYTVLLGATKSEGLPLELFVSGEPRWLGVQVNLPKEVEQPRVLLVSVPYALKAADAETLGGKPLSSFVLANPAMGGRTGVGTVFPTTGAIGVATIGGGGTQNFVAKFDATGANVINSSIFDTGTNVGIGTSSPGRSLHIKSAAPTIRLEDSTLPNSFWELQQSAFVQDTFGFLRYENGAAVADKSFVVSSAGNLGIGTGTPQRKLHIRSSAPVIRLEDTNLPNSFWELQQSAFFNDTFGFLRYENGSAVQSKSFVMSSAGNFGIGTGAPTQKLEVAGNVKISGGGNALTFPDGSVMSSAATGVGGGTITGVTAGTGLTGGGTTGGLTLGIANGGVTNAMLAASAVSDSNVAANANIAPSKIAGTAATLTATSNTFTGSITANSFIGNATTATTAVSFSGNLAGEVTGTQGNTVVSNAVAASTANAIVRRDGSGSFSAGTVTLAGNLALPNTTSSSVGVVTMGGPRFLHDFGTENTFLGAAAGNMSLTGDHNTGVGGSALLFDTTGGFNAAFGTQALQSNTTGSQNAAFGHATLFANTRGTGNSAFGYGALGGNIIGINNSAFGDQALPANSAGSNNAAFGVTALQGLSSGDSNIAIGASAGNIVASGSNNIYVGNAGGASNESNTIRIGAVGTQTAAFLAGISGATSAGGVAVFVNPSGQLGTITSSRRFKEEIADLGGESDLLMKLRPVAFFYKPELDETHTRQYGLVAEEVAQVAPQLVVFDKDGEPQTVRYHFVNAMLLNEVQKQRTIIVRQESKIQDLEARLARLEAAIAER